MTRDKKGFFSGVTNFLGVSSQEDDDDQSAYLYDEEEGDDFDEEPEQFNSRKMTRFGSKRREPEQEQAGAKLVSMPTQNYMKMMLYQPLSYKDTQNIIDNLRNSKPIIVNLENLEKDMQQRVLDFLSGAVYALSGSIHKVSKGIFVLAPQNVDIGGNIGTENEQRGFQSIHHSER